MVEQIGTEKMNTTQISNLIAGAGYMVAAGIAFALINAISYKVTSPADYGGLGFKSQSDLFWQYGIEIGRAHV